MPCGSAFGSVCNGGQCVIITASAVLINNVTTNIVPTTNVTLAAAQCICESTSSWSAAIDYYETNSDCVIHATAMSVLTIVMLIFGIVGMIISGIKLIQCSVAMYRYQHPHHHGSSVCRRLYGMLVGMMQSPYIDLPATFVHFICKIIIAARRYQLHTMGTDVTITVASIVWMISVSILSLQILDLVHRGLMGISTISTSARNELSLINNARRQYIMAVTTFLTVCTIGCIIMLATQDDSDNGMTPSSGMHIGALLALVGQGCLLLSLPGALAYIVTRFRDVLVKNTATQSNHHSFGSIGRSASSPSSPIPPPQRHHVTSHSNHHVIPLSVAAESSSSIPVPMPAAGDEPRSPQYNRPPPANSNNSKGGDALILAAIARLTKLRSLLLNIAPIGILFIVGGIWPLARTQIMYVSIIDNIVNTPPIIYLTFFIKPPQTSLIVVPHSPQPASAAPQSPQPAQPLH